MNQPKERFSLGKVTISRAAKSAIANEDVQRALATHASCNWGLCGVKRWAANDASVSYGIGKILSVYRTDSGEHFWVCTNEDQSETNVSLAKNFQATTPPRRPVRFQRKSQLRRPPWSAKGDPRRPWWLVRTPGWVSRKDQNVAWLMWFLFGAFFVVCLLRAAGQGAGF